MNQKMVLQDAFKGYTLDLDKIVSPEETVRRFREKLKKINLDILERTIRIDNGRLDIPIYFSLCGRDAETVIGTKKQMGKGGTPEQSEASAVMELAERFSFFSFCKDQKNFIIDEYRNLGEAALPYEYIVQSVHDQFEEAERAKELFARLPLKWAWGYNLSKRREVLVPFNWFFAINEFNGPSAGNCAEEAILQGISEVVERHVSSVISRDKLKTAAIELSTVTDPLALDLIEKYRKNGIRLHVSNFSLNTGIPSVGALAYDPTTFPAKSEIVWTAGTTPSPQKALIRALTEVAQLAGDFNSSSNYVASGLPKFKALREADFVLNSGKMIPISDLPDISDDNIRVEIENAVQALSEIGMEVIILDVTHPRLEIPAFYTVIPGAHFRERAAGTSVGMFSAKLIHESEDPERAIRDLEAVDNVLPGKYYVKFYLGVSHLSANRPSKSLRYLKEAFEMDPKEEDLPPILVHMGLCFKALEEYEKAIAVLETAEAYDKERTDVYNLMGFCYFKLKEHSKAIECFRKVIQLNPASAIDYANIGSNYREMGDRENAIRYYRFALELDPSISFAHENLRKLGAK